MEKFTHCTVEIGAIHTVHSAIDERGSLGVYLGTFFDDSQAKLIATGRGVYGGNGDIKTEDVLFVTTAQNVKKVFALKSKQEIDISHVTCAEPYDKINSALEKLKGMNLSAEEIKILANQLK
jgi:hypothetical protein